MAAYLAFGVTSLFAQQTKTEFSRRPAPDPKIQALKVGDRVPDILISKIIRDNKSTAKISDFKDQLLIFDFFDTFCGSCIDALPKLDSLQKHFGSKIKILPVSYQSEEVMRNFFKNNKFLIEKNVQLPCVVEDKVLGSHFQYKLISHEVWIYKGVVVAITGTDYVTAKNIQMILDGNRVNWPVKNDMVSFDDNNLIFAPQETDQYESQSGHLIYSGITGQRGGIDYRGGLKTTYDSVNHFYRTRLYNWDIVTVLRVLTYYNGMQPKKVMVTPARIILNVKDRSKYVYDKRNGFSSDWKRANQICYELVTAKQMDDKARFKYMLEDVSLKLGVTVSWEKRKMKCLVLTKIKDIDNLDSLNQVRNKTIKGGSQLDVSGLIMTYFDLSMTYPPVIDETDFKGYMVLGDEKLNGSLREQLNQYGLNLIEAEREADVIVITEKDWKPH